MPAIPAVWWKGSSIHDLIHGMMKEAALNEWTLIDKVEDEDASPNRSAPAQTLNISVESRRVLVITTYDAARDLLETGKVRLRSKDTIIQAKRGIAYKDLMCKLIPHETPPDPAVWSQSLLLLHEPDDSEAVRKRETWNLNLDDNYFTAEEIRGRSIPIVDAWIEGTLLQSWTPPPCPSRREDQTIPPTLGCASGTVRLHAACIELGYELTLGTFFAVTSWGSLMPGFDVGEQQVNIEDWRLLRSCAREMMSSFLSSDNDPALQQSADAARGRDWAQNVLYHYVAGASRPTAMNCPFHIEHHLKGRLDDRDLMSNVGFFTSPIVAEAFGSLAMAVLLQIFRKSSEGSSLADDLAAEKDSVKFEATLDAILTETDRLCPPIVSALRKWEAEQKTSAPENDLDVVAYISLANRDPTVFGADAEHFSAERYMKYEQNPPQPLSYGAGMKDCYGRSTVRRWLQTLIEGVLGRRRTPTTPGMDEFFDQWDGYPEDFVPQPPASNGFKMRFDEDALPDAVHEWLGWKKQGAEWKGAMEELPAQHPTVDIIVAIEAREAVQGQEISS